MLPSLNRGAGRCTCGVVVVGVFVDQIIRQKAHGRPRKTIAGKTTMLVKYAESRPTKTDQGKTGKTITGKHGRQPREANPHYDVCPHGCGECTSIALSEFQRKARPKRGTTTLNQQHQSTIKLADAHADNNTWEGMFSRYSLNCGSDCKQIGPFWPFAKLLEE